MGSGLAIAVVASALAIALHVALFVLFRRWMDRDLALSFAGDDAGKRGYMLARLGQAKATGVRRRELAAWLQRAAGEYAAGDADQASA